MYQFYRVVLPLASVLRPRFTSFSDNTVNFALDAGSLASLIEDFVAVGGNFG